jgi:hypothetical protein
MPFERLDWSKEDLSGWSCAVVNECACAKVKRPREAIPREGVQNAAAMVQFRLQCSRGVIDLPVTRASVSTAT